MTAGSTPTRARSTGRKSSANCSMRPGDARRDIDGQRQEERRRGEQKEYRVRVLRPREDEREPIAGDRLPQRKGDRAPAPRRSLRGRGVRDELAGPADRDRNTARHESADDKARN